MEEMVTVTDEALAKALEMNQSLQQKESTGDGESLNADYISLAKPLSKALKKSQPDLYIEGLSLGDFYVQKKKINLGARIKVVPLAFISIFTEKENATMSAMSFGTWNYAQGSRYPLAEGSFYNRELPNGHILVPSNWVFVEVIGHPELENAIISYKSTGSRIWREWKKDTKSRSGSSATLCYELYEETYTKGEHDWTDINFKFAENLLETDKKMALLCLNKSNTIRGAYERHELIADRDVTALSLPSALDENGMKSAVTVEDDDLPF